MGREEVEPLTYSVETAARLLGIGRNSAFEAIRQGQLPAVRIGRRLLVPRRAIEKMLDEANSNIAGDEVAEG